MAGKPQPTPLEAFEANIGDAERLVLLAEAFTNQRSRKMRTEKRRKVGEALGVPKRDRDHLDCIESDDAFVVLMPGGRLSRDHFTAHDPLLRQAIVAACAALESYLGDRAIKRVRDLINGGGGELPKRLREIRLTLEQWTEVEQFDRRKRIITDRVLAPHIRREVTSTAPSKIGELLSLVGIPDGLKRLDSTRRVPKGRTESELQLITNRRNQIAHEGDRRGRSRAPISVDVAENAIVVIRSVVDALEVIFDG